MTTPTFEDVVVPQGDFIGWNKTPGQIATITVLSFEPNGGTDANGNVCPRIIGTLVEDFTSYSGNGAESKEIPKGELVTLNCGQANLKRGVMAANAEPGDILRIHFNDTAKTTNGTAKLFDIKIARATHTPSDDDLV